MTDRYEALSNEIWAAAQEVKPNPRAPQWLREAIERSAE